MKSATFHGLILATAASAIAGCTSASPTGFTPAGEPRSAQRAATTYRVLFNFSSTSGANPVAGLVAVKGALYGTTQNGGTDGYGTVFSITFVGKQRVLHSFAGGNDGKYPAASVIGVKGTLYGTTPFGGGHGIGEGDGTVFGITTSGEEHVLHAFAGDPDGANPVGGLAAAKNRLYGATEYGGLGCQATGNGSIYDVTPAGKEAVLDAFKCNGHDGSLPVSSLSHANATFYGTTYADNGAVFEVTSAGKLHVLHTFGGPGSNDGAGPAAGLIYLKGTLYGTTTLGGSGNCAGYGTPGCGTVFAIDSAGKESVLYSFKGGNDGAYPYAGLTVLGDALYGTTREGGGKGRGTVFVITTSGSESVLHRFSGRDGSYPYAPLVVHGVKLYGTTSGGGSHQEGTVFSLTP